MIKWQWSWLVPVFILLPTLIFFQNCSNSMKAMKMESLASSSTETEEFSDPLDRLSANDQDSQNVDTTDPETQNPPTICNPLNPQESCSMAVDTNFGLMGVLYYLNQDQASEFSGNLRNALLDDYREHGHKVPATIIMTTVDVSPRSWTEGFMLNESDSVRKEDGSQLLEWFSLDLTGFIQLPMGHYQFAIVSDDGSRLTLNGQTIVTDDGLHSPRMKCASQAVSFNDGEKKHLRLEYFQGPRDEIALQLYVRPWSMHGHHCDPNHGMTVVAAESYTRN